MGVRPPPPHPPCPAVPSPYIRLPCPDFLGQWKWACPAPLAGLAGHFPFESRKPCWPVGGVPEHGSKNGPIGPERTQPDAAPYLRGLFQAAFPQCCSPRLRNHLYYCGVFKTSPSRQPPTPSSLEWLRSAWGSPPQLPSKAPELSCERQTVLIIKSVPIVRPSVPNRLPVSWVTCSLPRIGRYIVGGGRACGGVHDCFVPTATCY